MAAAAYRSCGRAPVMAQHKAAAGGTRSYSCSYSCSYSAGRLVRQQPRLRPASPAPRRAALSPGHIGHLGVLSVDVGIQNWRRGGRQCQQVVGNRRLPVCSAGQSLFPGGQKQAKVKLPALLIEVNASDVMAKGGGVLQLVDEAVAGGATGVVLYEGASEAGAAGLYDAACKLKNTLRGRAVLLVVDRTDIADAAEADGVLLTSRGVPIGVARRMLSGASSLVGVLARTTEEAVKAAEQGSNLIVLQGSEDGQAPTLDSLSAAVDQQKAGSIPVVASLGGALDKAPKLASSASGSGLCVSVSDLQQCATVLSDDATTGGSERKAAQSILEVLGKEVVMASVEDVAGASAPLRDAGAAPEQGASTMRNLLSGAREQLVTQEKQLLQDIVDLLEEVSPEISEIDLLKDAIVGLDELFLLVIVGEFNSGKSSFINALLGERFLAEGILPTTNEISVLRYTDGAQREEQDSDGMYQRYLPAELLKEVNIVDTPGTNVVLERQQRLTEEYIPRADLVLFVMSADRPFTDSEVKFLQYIRQWGKKVVFVINKADLLADSSQVEQVRDFVRSNALELLGVEGANVLAISSRDALQAKIESGSALTGGVLCSMDDAVLGQSPTWTTSGFAELEAFLLEFLLGGGASGKASESVRLKLETPLSVADALLGASGQQLSGDLKSAKQDLEALRSVETQLASFFSEMQRDSGIQRERLQSLVRVAAAKAEEVVDAELKLSSSNLTTYLFDRDGQASNQPVAQKFSPEAVAISKELQTLVEEHSLWVSRNVERQATNYRSFAQSRAGVLGMDLGVLDIRPDPQESSPAHGDDAEEGKETAQAAETEPVLALAKKETAMVAVQELEASSVALLLNEEVRESFVTTGSAISFALILEVLLTAALPTTLEDILATVVSGVFGYLAILNLPIRRAETKEKVSRVAENFGRQVDAAMKEELDSALRKCMEDVLGLVNPLIVAAEEEVKKIEGAEKRRTSLVEQLDDVRDQASNMD